MMRDMESQNLSAELCRESCDTGGVEKKYFLSFGISEGNGSSKEKILQGGISSDFSRKEILLREELSFLSDRTNSVDKIFLFFCSIIVLELVGRVRYEARHGVRKLVSRTLP
ncbi:hypothetical protein CDAR_33641 [Caerostris darwini]|uniref:Uncharacterized protein n=1 Tax=Caerostris darwini TaxID=1538125 RepID=A0AAV4S426_9ARAC|nr:hypothetical protein CDAR_33641 [Caerostris darwini]